MITQLTPRDYKTADPDRYSKHLLAPSDLLLSPCDSYSNQRPECLLPWKMQETQVDWTFTKLLECILSISSSHLVELLSVETEVVCKLSKEINSPERVEVPLGFVIEPCCKENGNFIRYLYPTASISPGLGQYKSTRRNSFMSVDHM